jgi:hypothetical protein
LTTLTSPPTTYRHADRDEIRRRGEEDFVNVYLEAGGTRRGKSLKCNFHEDRTPSATIYKGRFHCFSCGVSYDVFDFIERVYRVDFPGALEMLADRYGVVVDHHALSDAERREHARRRAAAESEAPDLVAWKTSMIESLRSARDAYMHAYHRSISYILRNGFDAPQSGIAFEAAYLHEPRYQEFDRKIALVKKASYRTLLPFYRRLRKV